MANHLAIPQHLKLQAPSGFVFAFIFKTIKMYCITKYCVPAMLVVFIYLLLAFSTSSPVKSFLTNTTNQVADTNKDATNNLLFDSLHLGKLGLGRRAYEYAMLGYHVLKAKGNLANDKIISIADMSAPSRKKRFFVIDIKNYKLLFVTYVAHGKKSGVDQTLYFSNEPESYKTSVGFYITSSVYVGKHGYSMRLEGKEIGFNNNAMERDIVMHSADYVSETVVKSQGYLGRSLGCPALSMEVYRPIIDKIKNGSCLFIYGNDSKYIINSGMLKRPIKLQNHN